MKKLTLLIVLFSFLLTPIFASASQADGVYIKQMMIDRGYGEKIAIHLDKRPSPAAACQTNGSWEYVLDISDPLGKSLYTSLLTAYSAGKPVMIVGTDSCGLIGGIEALGRIVLK